MAIKKTTQQFIEKAQKIHGDKYDYSKVDYKGNAVYVIIICPIHGEFQQMPKTHLKGCNCPLCTGAKSRKKTTEQFVETSNKRHSNFYSYDKSNYINNATKLTITCPIHGDFEQIAGNHMQGTGCQKCARIKTDSVKGKPHEQFIEDAMKVHGSRYSYEKTQYINTRIKVTITCKIHGDFVQNPANHLLGNGCHKCAYNRINTFSRSGYIEKAKGRTCTFYTLRCFNEQEEFYKIGITMNTVKQRYPGTDTMPYEYEVISEVKGSAGFIWDLEKDKKTELKEFHYDPSIVFFGSKTECFTKYEK